MAKGADSGKTFLQTVLSKITDPGLKAQAEAVFANAAVQVEIGNGVEGQSEIDRQLQDLRTQTQGLDTRKTELDQREARLQTWHGELTDWRAQNLELVKVGSAATKAGWKPGDPPAGDPGADPAKGKLPPGVVTQEQHDEYVRNTEQAFLGFQAEQNTLMRDHFTKFGEILDLTPLLRHQQVRELGLRGVYSLIHKDALVAKEAEAAKTAEEKIRADERAKVLAAQATQLPYPLTGVGADSSPLAAVGKTPAGALVDAATEHYNRLQAGRPAS
jgi:hypothetical protein